MSPSLLVIALANLLCTVWMFRDRLKKALEKHAEHRELLISLTASLKRKHIKRWTAEIRAWEEDDTLDDPYVATNDGTYVSTYGCVCH